MEPIGTNQPIILPAPVLTAPSTTQNNAPEITLPAPAATVLPAQVSFNAQAAEQKRVETIQQTAQQIANTFILGDQSFAIFKDMTGQYITRFTNLRDGKVTYIPEPTLFKLGGSGADTAPVLKIQA